jgi:uncharacterized repeat protein (TIGR01451 family)
MLSKRLLGAFFCLSSALTFAQVNGPTLTKTFTVPMGQLNPGETAILTFTISNPYALPLTGIEFHDILPEGLVISSPNGVTVSCSFGAFTAPAGGNGIGISGIALAGNESCSFGVNVTATFPGLLSNTTTPIMSDQTPPGAPASATLWVSPLNLFWPFSA